jgi:hypothetical protein
VVLQFRLNLQKRLVGTTPRGFRPVSRRERLRLWLLVFALGLVLLTMRRIGSPQVQQNLQRWLHLESSAESGGQKAEIGERKAESGESKVESGKRIAESGTLQTVSPQIEFSAPAIETSTTQEGPTDDDSENGLAWLDQQLREIQDNTSFRPQEQAAWFALLARLQQSTPSNLSQQSMGTLSYTQLLQQPDVYRGKIVTLNGTVLREERLQTPENSVDIHTYHRLILKPAGGGEWPFVIYVLKLPEKFPHGDNLRTQIEVTGYFFKNWSYSWRDGLGLAPVVLAANIHWAQTITPKNSSRPGNQRLSANGDYLVVAIGVATLFALFMLWAVWKQTSRPSPENTGQSTSQAELQIHDQLRQLSEQESRE